MSKPAILVLAPPSSLTTRLIDLLTSSISSRPILTASPSASLNTTVTASPNHHFNWADTDTWWDLWGEGDVRGSVKTTIGAVYMAPPPVAEGTNNPAQVVEDFVDFARERGVRRFVLISSEGEGEGGDWARKVQGYLRGLEGPEGVGWAVLRAQWLQGARVFS